MTKGNAQVLDGEIFDLLGPTIQFVTPLSDDDAGFCLLRGTIPPGVVVPIHSHQDHETFYILEGQLEALKDSSWQTYGVGGVFDVPGGTKHAFRNVSGKDAATLIVTTMVLASFFQRVARPIASVPPGFPSREVLQRFAEASLAEGHWLGSVEDNAAIGINLLSFS